MADLEKRVKKEKPEEQPQEALIETKFEDLKKEIEPYRKGMPESPSLVARAKAAVANAANVARNAYDNTVGYAIAKGQNWKTRRHFSKDPESEDKIVYLMHGLMQNEGSQRKFGKQLRKEGFQPYHLKGNHHLSRKESAEEAFEQIEDFQRDTKLKNPSKRHDYFSGHSSGADVGIYMAGDKRIKEYGITKVQARAPAPYGIKAKRIGQKILAPLADKDDVSKSAGKRNAVELAAREPTVTVDVIAGRYDGLVPPSDAAYQHATHHYVIDHPDSTHFGTSGVNKDMNNVFIDHLKGEVGEKKKKEYKKAA